MHSVGQSVHKLTILAIASVYYHQCASTSPRQSHSTHCLVISSQYLRSLRASRNSTPQTTELSLGLLYVRETIFYDYPSVR